MELRPCHGPGLANAGELGVTGLLKASHAEWVWPCSRLGDTSGAWDLGYQAEPACLLDGVVDDVGSLLRQHVAGRSGGGLTRCRR
jgi:hypothetical protein